MVAADHPPLPSVPADRRGLAFGVHRSMDHAGAVAGPLVAALLLAAVVLVLQQAHSSVQAQKSSHAS